MSIITQLKNRKKSIVKVGKKSMKNAITEENEKVEAI